MAKIHDRFVVELAEVIKGYGNDPDVDDPFRLSEFFRFYELPNIAISRENFRKMTPLEDVAQVRHGRWETEIITDVYGLKHACYACSVCGVANNDEYDFCPNCGAKMDGGEG